MFDHARSRAADLFAALAALALWLTYSFIYQLRKRIMPEPRRHRQFQLSRYSRLYDCPTCNDVVGGANVNFEDGTPFCPDCGSRLNRK